MHFSTFSIVARDTATGHLAVAGASNGFAYGSIVPHVEAGVGAVATQAAVNLNYAAEGMLELRDGRSAQDTIVHLLQNDPDVEGKFQVLIIDTNGNTACHTGEHNYLATGHISRLNFACAGNTLVNEGTLQAIADYYDKSDEPFALKLIKSLQAGHEAGGDIRGIRSSAIKIVKGQRTEKFWEGTVLDLRTDDNRSPLEKLQQLYTRYEANIAWNKGFESTNAKDALLHFERALHLDPDNPEYMLWIAKTYHDMGKLEDSQVMLEKIKTYPGHWMEYWERLRKQASSESL